MTFHHAAERAVPHHEQTASSLPIKCLQRGQRIARCIISIPRSFGYLASEAPWVAKPQAFRGHLTLPLGHFTSKIMSRLRYPLRLDFICGQYSVHLTGNVCILPSFGTLCVLQPRQSLDRLLMRLEYATQNILEVRYGAVQTT
jgi:hypothetical protein